MAQKIKFFNVIRIAAVLILFSGCMVGPDYVPPIIDTPEQFRYQTKGTKEALNIDWWKQFQDPVLDSLIVEALENNLNVKIAAANIETAFGVLIQTRSPLFPQFGYSGFYNRNRNSLTLAATENLVNSPFALKNPQTTWQAVFNGSFDIDIWGRIRRQIESARANLFATYEARQNVILSLVASVANSYVQLLSLDEQLAISIRTMNSYREAVEYFELQFKYGQASQMAVAQAKTQYEIAAATVPQIKAQIVQMENAISVLLGSNPKAIPRGKTIYSIRLPDVPADIPSEVLLQRPDIAGAEQKLIAANAQIGAAFALYFPSISLTGNYGGASQHLDKLFSGPSKVWNFTGSVTGPIFTAGAIYGQITQAKGQQQAALFNYKETIIQAFADVEDALISHDMLGIKLVAEERLVKAAGDYQDLSTLQYKGGYVPYYVVIQAQTQYFPAQLSWVQTKAEFLQSLINIYQSMGGGWVVLAEERTGEIPLECDPVPLP